MVIDMTDFEYQKENIVPLPQGRSAKILSALYAKDSVIDKIHDEETSKKETDSLTGKELREIRKKEFENELKDIDEVDDPLDTYFKYINWIQENYPTGNDTETGLLSLLETVLKKYQSDPRYLNDGRYLRLWFLYAHYSQEPIEIFKFLSVNDIGQNLSTYYEEYALFMETQNKYKEANEIYTLGINRKAQPIERLRKRYIEFQKRMILSVNKPADEIDSPSKDDHQVKSSFLNTKNSSHTKRIPLQVKRVSSTATDFSHINDQNRNPNIGNDNNASFTIFEDKEKPKDIKDELFGSHQEQKNQKDVFSSEHSKHTPKGNLLVPSADETNEWHELGTHNLRRKENIRELESWRNVTIPQKTSLINRRFLNGSNGSQSPVSFTVFEDPVEPEIKTPTTTLQDNIYQSTNTNCNEKPKSNEVYRCLMNMIYAQSINNLYKEIVKEKERIITRKRAGLRNERMNENLRKLDEKTFNKIKRNIDWSYDPQKNNHYNSFECKSISEFSIEEIRAKYHEKGQLKKHREEEVLIETTSIQTIPSHSLISSSLSPSPSPILSSSSSSKNNKNTPLKSKSSPSSHSSKDGSVTNRSPPLKKYKSLTEISIPPNTIHSISNINANVNVNNTPKNKAKMKIQSNNTHNEEDKENQMKADPYTYNEYDSNNNNNNEREEEDEETRYTVKQDLKLFIPHDLSTETFSPPSIPRTRLLTKKALNSRSPSTTLSGGRNHKSPSSIPRLRHAPGTLKALLKAKTTRTSTILSSTSKSITTIKTPVKSNNLTINSPTLLQSTPSRISSKSNSNSSVTLLGYSSRTPTPHSSNRILTKSTSISTTSSPYASTSSSSKSKNKTNPNSTSIISSSPSSSSASILKVYSNTDYKSPYTPIASKLRPPMVSSPSPFISSTPTHSNSKEKVMDPFGRHESFHLKNSPTVTIYTKNAYAVVNEWFNEPCDEENMDNLYMENTISGSDIDNTFFLKKKK